MSSETYPPQPEGVDRAIREVLTQDATAPDPWWQAGIEEALEE